MKRYQICSYECLPAILQTHRPYLLVINTDNVAVSFFSDSVSSLLNDIQSRTNRRFYFCWFKV